MQLYKVIKVWAFPSTNAARWRAVSYMLGGAQEPADWMKVIRWIMTEGGWGIETGYSSLFSVYCKVKRIPASIRKAWGEEEEGVLLEEI